MAPEKRGKVKAGGGNGMFLEDLQKRFAEMQNKAGVQAVFGEPIQLDGRTVIPVASIRYGFGMGGGTGPRKDRDGDTVGGGGGGGAARIEPVALIEAVDGRIRVQPIINVTRLAAIAAGVLVWAIFWITRTARVMATRR